MNIKKFKTRKEVTEFLKTKDIDTTNWSEEKWLSINKSQAEIHIQALAEDMWDAKNESVPVELKGGEWHIPFGDRMDDKELMNEAYAWINRFEEARKDNPVDNAMYTWDTDKLAEKAALKVGVARAARLSYMTFDGEIDYAKDVVLHDRLFESKHMSPFEHVARCMSDEEYGMYTKEMPRQPKNPNYFTNKYPGWCANFRGFIPYRFLIENDSL